MTANAEPSTQTGFVPPHPGTKAMPRWDAGELPDPPRFTAKNWVMLLGPGLVMGGAAIGGGEWLTGPAVTARYGGALLWLATLSILAQVVYNLEISRYTLYTGEPIFTGKFRMPPAPTFWLLMYLVLDFGSVFPYLAANAATPVAAVILRRLPDVASAVPVTVLGISMTEYTLVRGLTYMCFLLALLPMVFGGKVYNSMKVIMSAKIVIVVGFLLFLAICFSDAGTWKEICSGFLKFGNVPVESVEDRNGNGVLDPGEDWDSDGHLDVIEPKYSPTIDSNNDGIPDKYADVNGDGKPDTFNDIDGDGIRDGTNVENAFISVFSGKRFPTIELSMIGLLAAMASISGQGGLTNTVLSAYVRDQGWGMGKHVGAIPSAIGGRDLSLSHVGIVFPINRENVSKFKQWFRHVLRDQLVVWMPACFVGLALPAMLSVHFLRRGVEVSSWNTSAMTADGVAKAVGPTWGPLFWGLTLFCGFIVLLPSNSNAADGFLRRWVDVFWTGSATLRKLEPHKIRYLYFTVLCTYAVFGIIMLSIVKEPTSLLVWATTLYNSALGFSCFHTLAVNTTLLPPELRPGWFNRIGLVLGGIFFLALAVIAVLRNVGYI